MKNGNYYAITIDHNNHYVDRLLSALEKVFHLGAKELTLVNEGKVVFDRKYYGVVVNVDYILHLMNLREGEVPTLTDEGLCLTLKNVFQLNDDNTVLQPKELLINAVDKPLKDNEDFMTRWEKTEDLVDYLVPNDVDSPPA